MTGSIFIFYFRSSLGPLNISNKQVRMFQTVPDTSSYVKVRHDSIFKQVMSKITILPNSQSFYWLKIHFLTEFSRGKKSALIFNGREVRDWNIKCIILEMCRVESEVVSLGTNNEFEWACPLSFIDAGCAGLSYAQAVFNSSVVLVYCSGTTTTMGLCSRVISQSSVIVLPWISFQFSAFPTPL